MKNASRSRKIRSDVDAFLATHASSRRHATRKSHAVAVALTTPDKHKGDRFRPMLGQYYRAGWDAAGASLRSRNDVIDALAEDVPGVLAVVVDMLIDNPLALDRALKEIYMMGGYKADLENEAIRSQSSVEERYGAHKNPSIARKLVDEFKRSSDGQDWLEGYSDRVLDVLEKKSGMREA